MSRTLREVTAIVAATALACTLNSGVAAAVQPTSPDTSTSKLTSLAGKEVVLVTGDTVRVDAVGRVLGFQPAKDRESIPVIMTELKGHSYVLPSDVGALISEGKLDQRLFDVTELSNPAYEKMTGSGVPVIVQYAQSGAAARSQAPAARAAVRGTTGAAMRAELKSVHADALTVGKGAAASAWAKLTRASTAGRTLAPGVARIRLDGLAHATLDQSVTQIGAPTAWEAGYDGEGVQVAVLDTGIATTHADLTTQVVAAKNFTDSADEQDHYGHGTHVSSTVAGTGAASDGKYRGVAPGAQLINGKVMNDDGFGVDSWIVAGMEWAVEQGADIVNMSLGEADQPGVSPLEEAVDRLSDQALFVIAAGNDGPIDGTLGSPASVEDALSVGAVDRTGALAEFSSRGPRTGDSGLKPDITGPGVGIVAAGAAGSRIDRYSPHPAPGYIPMSGTSMAAPHVAGAAAILRQEHPDWTPAQIKSALVGSATPGPYTPMEGGSGIVDLAGAIAQDVIAEQSSLSFGAALWPHDDDAPLTKTLTYRNLGTEPATLDLAVEGTGPDGASAPAGFFTFSATQVTVPAGGIASVDVTADTRLGGDLLGVYDLAITATGDGTTVRTVGAVNREEQMHELTFKATARDGSVPVKDKWYGWVYDFDRGIMTKVSGDAGTTTLRMHAGTYTVLGEVPLIEPATLRYIGDDWVAAPEMRLTEDTTIEVDARTTQPIDIKAPDPGAVLRTAYATVTGPDGVNPVSMYVQKFPQGFRTRWVGPKPPAGTAYTHLIANLVNPTTGVAYHLTDLAEGFYTGLDLHPSMGELARIDIDAGSSAPNRWGVFYSAPSIKAPVPSDDPDLPMTNTVYLTGNQSWQRMFEQRFGAVEAAYAQPFRYYKAGHTYREHWNEPVFGPALVADAVTGAPAGLTRDGDRLSGAINPFADGVGHDGTSRYDAASSSTVLYRNGQEYARVNDILDVNSFDLPPGEATYKLVTTADRTATGTFAVSKKVVWTATFTSAHTKAPTPIPVGVVRYEPKLRPDGTAAAGTRGEVKVDVQGSTDSWKPASLRVYASYDHGATWRRLVVAHGAVSVANPAAGGSVSFKAEFRDRNRTFSQTILDAYTTS
ncbi:S8 family serine peptidase [Micromonospora sp. NPDC005206]|uniref:S8 family serine peptidase n=1 Tax=Micromonospora sp. NPDC005206 TaxID=3157022 RepID=UPI0033BEDC4E